MLEEAGKPDMAFLAYRDHGVPNYYQFVIVSNRNWIEKSPVAACRFLRATAKGPRNLSR